ncbi:MAG: DUF2628 domain-containing protein [Alphaproteobacteria bacterium]|nr:MAG: DUF2628 domain-containing protein [Alphaproteobacteria bacterium]
MRKLTREDFYNAVKGPNEGGRPSLYESHYYMNYYDKLGDRSRFIQWNWSAFFGGGAWMFYRRMFGFASAIIFINLFCIYFIIDGALEKNYTRLIWPIIVHVGIKVWLGIFGNIIYTAHIRRVLTKRKVPTTIEGDILWAYYAIHLVPILIASF